MANLQIKGIEDKLYQELKSMASDENRSISQQMLFLIRKYLSKKSRIDQLKPPAQVLLELSGSWQDSRDTETIIAEIKSARKNSKKLSQGL